MTARLRTLSRLLRSTPIKCFFFLAITVVSTSAASIPLYIGTYTSGEKAGRGIYASRLDLITGKLSPPFLAAEIPDPSYLAVHPSGKLIYSVSESKGRVFGFGFSESTLALRPIDRSPSGGKSPCFVAVDKSGRNLFVANYGDGTVAGFKLAADGALVGPTKLVKHSGSSIDLARQKSAHPHSVAFSPGNRFAYVSDLGIDKIVIYHLSRGTKSLSEKNPPYVKLRPGSGPRHLCFHPSGEFAYSINELDSTVTAFDFDHETGMLFEIQSLSTLPPWYNGRNSAAHIAVHPNGRFLYASNRGHDSIVVYRLDSSSGELSIVEHETETVETPRHFAIDPEGKYCIAANKGSGLVSVFRIDPDDGSLRHTGNSIPVPRPVCVLFIESTES